MKWQKNTGVMPCDFRAAVAILYDDRLHTVAIANDVRWEIVDGLTNIEYYCVIGDMPPFDYVEPKVWTVDYNATGGILIKKLGYTVFDIARNSGSLAASDYLLDALNAMEERNGTV
jgi:hypothetical protein